MGKTVPGASPKVPFAGCSEEMLLRSLSQHERSPAEKKRITNYYILNYF